VVKVIWQKTHRRRTWMPLDGSPYALQWAVSSPPPKKMPLPMGSTQVHTLNGISIGSAVLQGSQSWQTDRSRYTVCNNRPHPVYVVLRCGLIILRSGLCRYLFVKHSVKSDFWGIWSIKVIWSLSSAGSRWKKLIALPSPSRIRPGRKGMGQVTGMVKGKVSERGGRRVGVGK